MICRMVADGKRVGVTAKSHKVIRNLLDKVREDAATMHVNVCCIQKPGEMEPDQDGLVFAKDNGAFLTAFANGSCQVGGATTFVWAKPDAVNSVDVLVVDEAAQMSLANVIAASPCAPRLILLGDSQQLDQPTQGTHPDGVGVSSLEHVHGSARCSCSRPWSTPIDTCIGERPPCDVHSALPPLARRGPCRT